MSKKSSSDHYHKTFIIMVVFAFVLSVGFALIFNLLFEQMETMQYQVMKLDDKVKNITEQVSGIQVDEENSDILPPKMVIADSVKEESAWLRKDMNTIGIRFFYPADYIVSGDESLLYVSPRPKVSDETPLPVATVKKVPNKTKQSITNFVRTYYSGKALGETQTKNLNGIEVIEVDFEEVSDTFSTCQRYVLRADEETFLEIAPYECFEWEHLDTFIESFTKK